MRVRVDLAPRRRADLYSELYCVTRPAAGGVVGEGLGAIENALLDAKAKALGVPCYVMEVDVDRLPWDDKVFTTAPQFDNGHLVVPDTPGWGTEPNEEATLAHPPKAHGGLLHCRQS